MIASLSPPRRRAPGLPIGQGLPSRRCPLLEPAESASPRIFAPPGPSHRSPRFSLAPAFMHGVGAVFDLCFNFARQFLRHTARKCFDASLRRRITVFSWLVPLWMAVSSQASALLFLASRGVPVDPESFRFVEIAPLTARNLPSTTSEVPYTHRKNGSISPNQMLLRLSGWAYGQHTDWRMTEELIWGQWPYSTMIRTSVGNNVYSASLAASRCCASLQILRPCNSTIPALSQVFITSVPIYAENTMADN